MPWPSKPQRQVRFLPPAPEFRLYRSRQYTVLDDMSKVSYDEKSRQLGLSISTATKRLGRKLLFRLYQRLGEDVCFRCGEKIERLDDFTLDHKRPWLHVDPQLFWDVDNVVASHGWCNSGARRSRPKKYKTTREQWRSSFAKMYNDPDRRERWNARRRELYKIKMALSSSG